MLDYRCTEIAAALEFLQRDKELRVVTVFCVPFVPGKKKQTIRVARRGRGADSFVVTIGPPNSKAHKFLKLCKRADAKPRKFHFQFYRK